MGELLPHLSPHYITTYTKQKINFMALMTNGKLRLHRSAHQEMVNLFVLCSGNNWKMFNIETDKEYIYLDIDCDKFQLKEIEKTLHNLHQ